MLFTLQSLPLKTLLKQFTLWLFAITLLGCATQTDNTNKVTSSPTKNSIVKGAAPQSSHRLAPQLADSKATNASDRVTQLIQAANNAPDTPEPIYNLAYAHMQSAYKTKNQHEMDLAAFYFNEVLSMVPGNVAVLKALYNIYYDQTLHTDKTDAFAKAKSTFAQLPESAHAEMNPPSLAKFAATALAQEKNKESDRQALRDLLLNAIQESPASDNAYLQLARLYREDRYFYLALATLKLGLENNPKSVDILQAIAETYNKRAEVNDCNYEHSEDIVSAAHYYLQAVPLSADNPELHLNLSRNFLDQNLPQLALNETQIAVDLHSDAESLAILAQHYSMIGMHQKAKEAMQIAISKGYRTSETSYHEIAMNRGDWKTAAAGFTAYMKDRNTYTVYDLIKSDIIAHQAQQTPWIVNKKISLANDWEEALFNFWTRKISDADLKKIALNRCAKTEYNFYSGYRDLEAGLTQQAKTKFDLALHQDTFRFIERPLARYFLSE